MIEGTGDGGLELLTFLPIPLIVGIQMIALNPNPGSNRENIFL